MRTREEDTRYRRELRARQRTEKATADATVVNMPTRTGEVEQGVRAELAMLTASADHPGIASMALRLAQIMDDSAQAPHHSAAGRTLADLLGRLNDASAHARGGGKLLEMRQARRDE
jgi:hypothetical protein